VEALRTRESFALLTMTERERLYAELIAFSRYLLKVHLILPDEFIEISRISPDDIVFESEKTYVKAVMKSWYREQRLVGEDGWLVPARVVLTDKLLVVWGLYSVSTKIYVMFVPVGTISKGPEKTVMLLPSMEHFKDADKTLFGLVRLKFAPHGRYTLLYNNIPVEEIEVVLRLHKGKREKLLALLKK
jgi:hypothetical protein